MSPVRVRGKEAAEAAIIVALMHRAPLDLMSHDWGPTPETGVRVGRFREGILLFLFFLTYLRGFVVVVLAPFIVAIATAIGGVVTTTGRGKAAAAARGRAAAVGRRERRRRVVRRGVTATLGRGVLLHDRTRLSDRSCEVRHQWRTTRTAGAGVAAGRAHGGVAGAGI